MNVFKWFSQRVIKWWRVVVVSVLKIDNNDPGQSPAGDDAEKAQAQGETGAGNAAVPEGEGQHVSAFSQEAIPADTSEDAMAVLNRINREKEDARAREIEEQRKKSEEAARIASIMQAGKVDVNAFIEEGRSKAAEQKAEVPKEEAKPDATEEQLRRAQEIMDRLNREAAEDEAKKQAEIEAAKAAAHEAGLS